MNEKASTDKTPRGLYGKFHVRKDGEMGPILNCFILRYDRDHHARVALAAYAESVRAENEKLSDDLRAVLRG
jgi:hypothetical protein